jgi:hypothetical protein
MRRPLNTTADTECLEKPGNGTRRITPIKKTSRLSRLGDHLCHYFGGAGSSIASSGARTVKKVIDSTNRAISGVS